MPLINPYEQKFGKAGSICPSCGQWVPDGVLHRCGKDPNVYTPTSTVPEGTYGKPSNTDPKEIATLAHMAILNVTIDNILKILEVMQKELEEINAKLDTQDKRE